MTDLKTVSLFAGIGGIDRGLELAGATTALQCELDPHARKILARHYPHAAIHNDVTELTADDCRAAGAVPGRTVLTAGWPCQGNSVAGARGGMDDPRSGLWSHVVRLLAEHRPAWFIGENVPGVLSVNDGRDFSVVLHDLARLGYGFCWRILDARYFGVPQRRRRVVIVGRLGDTGAASAQVLLEPEGLPGDLAAGITPRQSIAGDARAGAADGGPLDRELIGFAYKVGGNRSVADAYAMDLAPTLPRSQPLAVVYVAQHTTALDTAQGGADDNTAQGGQLVALESPQGTIIRQLTPLECERLQGYPDDWTGGQSNSQRLKQLGNSVAVPVFEWVGRRLVAVDNHLEARAS